MHKEDSSGSPAHLGLQGRENRGNIDPITSCVFTSGRSSLPCFCIICEVVTGRIAIRGLELPFVLKYGGLKLGGKRSMIMDRKWDYIE
jgi:hypothetical protein